MGCCWISDWGRWLAGLILHLGMCVYRSVFQSFCEFGGYGGGDGGGGCGCGGVLVAMDLMFEIFFFFYGFGGYVGGGGGGLIFFVCLWV